MAPGGLLGEIPRIRRIQRILQVGILAACCPYVPPMLGRRMARDSADKEITEPAV